MQDGNNSKSVPNAVFSIEIMETEDWKAHVEEIWMICPFSQQIFNYNITMSPEFNMHDSQSWKCNVNGISN